MFNQSIENQIKKILKGKPGIHFTIGVKQNNESSFVAYNTDFIKEHDTDLRYEIGSLTKLFTASLLAKAIGEQRIGLNESVSTYLPEIKGGASIRRIASHTSGYKGYLPFSPWHQYKMLVSVLSGGKACFNNPFRNTTSTQSMIASLQRIELKDQDYAFMYSNINYSLLGTVLASVYETPYTDLMQSFIEHEIGLEETSFEPKSVIEGHASFTKKTGNWLWETSDSAIASGGLYSTAQDLLQFAHWSRINPSTYLNPCRSVLAKGTKGYDMALGWKMCKDMNAQWHNGGTGSFNTFLGYHRESGAEVVILSNYRSLLIDKLGLEILKFTDEK